MHTTQNKMCSSVVGRVLTLVEILSEAAQLQR
jgi:hypothetical protein